jgi:hypothetical protein
VTIFCSFNYDFYDTVQIQRDPSTILVYYNGATTTFLNDFINRASAVKNHTGLAVTFEYDKTIDTSFQCFVTNSLTFMTSEYNVTTEGKKILIVF